MDVPGILVALPRRWRYRVAPAMAKEFFDAHFHREQYGWRAWSTNTLNYLLASQFFAAFPLPRREAGTRETLRHIGETVSDGYSIIIFPEGERTVSGEIAPFRPGVGMIASKLDLPVVPVRLEGLDRVLHRKMSFPKRGPVRVTFGAPIRMSGTEYEALAKRVEQAVGRL
jgi:long-chain acyl-CoA synthetase